MKNLKIGKNVMAVLLGGTMLMGSVIGCEEVTFEQQETLTETGTKVFDVGEHILTDSVMWKGDVRRLEYHEGYEIIAVAQGDKLITVVYQNIVPVECIEYDGKCEYNEFGAPVELEKTTETTYKLN